MDVLLLPGEADWELARAGPCGYILLFPEPWLLQPLRLFLEFPLFVIKLVFIPSSVARGQELCCSVPELLWAVNAEPFVPSSGVLLTHHVLLAFPFLPWLSPLGAARRERGGRRMAEPFL